MSYEKTVETQLVRPTLRYVVKYKVIQLCVLFGVLTKFHECYITNNSNWTLGVNFSHYFSLKNLDPYDHYAACWFPLKEGKNNGSNFLKTQITVKTYSDSVPRV